MKAILKCGLQITAVAFVFTASVVSTALFVGIVFEHEFPYFLTIRAAARAEILTGEPAAAAIARALNVPPGGLDWHRCSFCRNFDGDEGAGTVRVQVSAVTGDYYKFAFDRKKGVLFPDDERTRAMLSPGRGLSSARGR